MKKRLLSLLCASSLLFSCLPMSGALATAENGYYLLSGNNFSTTDKELYKAYDENIDLTSAGNAASYTWLDTANAVNGNDSSNAKLTDGHLNNGSGDYVINTIAKYDTPTVVFDLNGNFAVDRVDILQNNTNTGNYLKNVKVYVSDDNETYTEAGSTDVDSTEKFIADSNFIMTSVKFDVQKARYVKIELTRGANKFIVCEASIFGYKRDTTELKAAVKKAKAYTDKWYTTESVSALSEVIEAGEKLTEASAQTDINTATANIETAIRNLVPKNERLVLTGNEWKSSDVSDYKDLTGITLKKAENTPSYTLETNGTATEYTTPYLTNGGILQTSTGNYAHASVFGSNAEVITAKFDLDTVGIIDRADVFTISGSTNSGQKKTDNITISYSEDGTEYTVIENKKAVGADDTGTQSVYRHNIFTFAPVKARYIKIDFAKAAGVKQQFLSEVIIFGIGNDYSELSAELGKYTDTSVLEKYATSETWNVLKQKLADAKAMIAAQEAGSEEQKTLIKEIKEAAGALKYNVSNYGVLSNNLVTTTEGNLAHEPEPITTVGDFDLYDGMKNIPIGMSYSIKADGSNVENDTSKLLFGGHIMEADGKYSLWNDSEKNFNHTESASYEITVDAGEEVYFTGADLYEQYRKGDGLQTRKIKSIKIEVSSDDVNYSEVATVVNPCSEDKTGINKIDAAFAAVKGRYLKITTTKEGKYQILAELVVKGFRDPTVMHYPLECSAQTTIEDATGNTKDTLLGADYIYTTYTITENTTQAGLTYSVYAAVYDDDRTLLEVTRAKLDNDNNLYVEFENLGGLKANSKMISYIWNNMTPVAEPTEVK